MCQADIRGKISTKGSNLSDSLEDLLTSNVFGPLRYIPPSEGLIPILKRSRLFSARDERLPLDLQSEVKEISFWPRLDNCEPDVCIKLNDALVLIEAKYLSGKSGVGAGEDQDSETVASAPRDQLAKEFLDLMNIPGNFQHRILIYVTAHNTLPEKDMWAGLHDISDRAKVQYKSSCYWLSWSDIHAEVRSLIKRQTDSYRRCVLEDIRSLLFKKGFRQFEGFSTGDLVQISLPQRPIFYLKPGAAKQRDLSYATTGNPAIYEKTRDTA
jgi:hypothetical protein